MNLNNNKFKPGLYCVATPIGNLQDISFRAVDILKHSNLILCENPRHSLKLLNELKIKKKLISIHDYNEVEVIRKISKNLKNSIISLISDAGSPMISDPGFKLIQHCIKENIFIPKGAIHRMANKQTQDLIIIEMWYGEKLDETDIKRYEDIYKRV